MEIPLSLKFMKIDNFFKNQRSNVKLLFNATVFHHLNILVTASFFSTVFN